MKIQITGLREVINKFEQMPEKVESGLWIALRISLRDIQEHARDNHKFTSRSGETEREIQTRIGENISGEVFLNSKVGVYLHEGTGIYGPSRKVIEVKPRQKMALRWVSGDNFVFAKRVEIKGIEPDPFLYNAADHERPAIISRFDAAIQKIVEG